MKKIPVIYFLLFPVLIFARNGSGGNDKPDWKPQEVVLRLKESYREEAQVTQGKIAALQKIFLEYQVDAVTLFFPHARNPSSVNFRTGTSPVDLSLIYRIHFLADKSITGLMDRISATGIVIYAEPIYLQEALYTPSDTMIASQYFLNNIQAFAGWDISKGDTNTVIGIVDSGTDWDHPDLAPNIELNYSDPINGIDDDSDGFIDNFHGWDISENDNDPTVGVQVHGSHVSGCASAATDNFTGVAGTGFHCRLLPVKASLDASSTSIDNGYEGIVYAADHDCDIINCSWGRRGGPSHFEQDVINYATVNGNALVIAAAGNQGNEANFFPASYDHVLSVAATNQADQKPGFSNYNYQVDVCAPGDSIASTVYNDTYGAKSGTSMAAPITSGCAAIVKSFNPGFTPAQVGARLRSTCDNIYGVGTNALYNRKLGNGRINLYRALTDSLLPGIEVSNLVLDDANNNAFLPNDTIRISALFRNLLHPSSNLVVTLSTTSPYITLLRSNYAIGALNTFDSVSNQPLPFLAKVLGAVPLNTSIEFVMTMTDGSYNDFYAFKIDVNIDYLNVTVNDISTTVNSKGRIGYNSPNQTDGLGFTYLSDETLLFEAGLMIGTSITKVSDCVQGAVSGDDEDFSIVSVLTRRPSLVSAFDATGKFNDAISTTSPIPVLVTQYVYAWDNVPYRKFVVFKYAIRNSGTAPVANLYAGLLADWDLADYLNNKCSVDASRNMGYTWSTDTNLYAGIKLLSFGLFNQYAVDMDSSGLGGLDLTDGFTTAEKYISMSTTRTDAGVSGAGHDVVDIVSTGPFSLAAGDSVVVGFALIAGDSLPSLRASADDAQHLYDSLLTAIPEIHTDRKFSINKIFPNPATQSATVSFSLDDYGVAELDVFDPEGRKVANLFSGKLPSGNYQFTTDVSSLSGGIYFLRLSFENKSVTQRLNVVNK